MADNYLEKQRELYEARKAAWLQSKKYGKKKKPGNEKKAAGQTNHPTASST